MKKLIIVVAALAMLAPATAGAGQGHGAAVSAAVKACKAEREALGLEAFRAQYGNKRGCVAAVLGVARNAAHECKAERAELGVDAFRAQYGTNHNGRNAFGKCVSSKVRDAIEDDDLEGEDPDGPEDPEEPVEPEEPEDEDEGTE